MVVPGVTLLQYAHATRCQHQCTKSATHACSNTCQETLFSVYGLTNSVVLQPGTTRTSFS